MKRDLERQARAPFPVRNEGRFALKAGVPERLAAGLSRPERELFSRLSDAPQPLDRLIGATAELATLDRLVARGLALIGGFTPSDAQHVLGRFMHWDREAARLGAVLFARRKDRYGNPIAPDAETISRRVVERLIRLSAERILETAFAEDGLDGAALAASQPVQRALDGERGIARLFLSLDRTLIGLGAGAAACHPDAGALLATPTTVPEHADVANAIGAVVGQVRVTVVAEIVQPAEGRFEIAGIEGAANLAFENEDDALETAERLCRETAERQAREAGAAEVTSNVTRDVKTVRVEGREQFISASVTATAGGRPATAR